MFDLRLDKYTLFYEDREFRSFYTHHSKRLKKTEILWSTNFEIVLQPDFLLGSCLVTQIPLVLIHIDGVSSLILQEWYIAEGQELYQPKSIFISWGNHLRNEDNLAGGKRESNPSFLALHSHSLLFVSGAGSLQDSLCLLALPTKPRMFLFRFIIECSSLMDFRPCVIRLFLYEDFWKMIFWLVLKLGISYQVIITWRILVSFRRFLEDYIFAEWNIWVSIILLLP